MDEMRMLPGFGRRGLLTGAAGLALGGAFGAPVLAQGVSKATSREAPCTTASISARCW